MTPALWIFKARALFFQWPPTHLLSFCIISGCEFSARRRTIVSRVKRAPDCTRRRPIRHPVDGFDRPALPRTCYWFVRSRQVSLGYQQRCQNNDRTRQVYYKQISRPLRLWFPTTPDANPWRGFPMANCQADPSQDSSICSIDITEKWTCWKDVD